jgi:hypothetical protein
MVNIMSVNTLTAIRNIVSSPIYELKSFYTSRNRANSMGDALENYIKDVFAGTLNETDTQKRNDGFSASFSYQGNQNNPPDIIISHGDAIEVKKIESKGASLALNSSYPKAKLFINNPMITEACRTCEDWKEKDLLYATGVAKEGLLTNLFFVYGIDYAASAEIYERMRRIIKQGVNEIPNVELATTNELGRINRVDPLGITYLRVRGMWGIENPARVFSYVYVPSNAKFEFAAIINTVKYNSFPRSDRLFLESINDTSFKISDVRIKTPDNPSVMKNAKLITFSI